MLITNPNKELKKPTSPILPSNIDNLAENIKNIFKEAKAKARDLRMLPTVGSLRKALTRIGEDVNDIIDPNKLPTKHIGPGPIIGGMA